MLPDSERDAWIRTLPAAELDALPYAWSFWARPKQLPPPGEWGVWVVKAGRGFGKTRTGAEWIRAKVEQGARRLALVSDTAADVRDVMVEGPSGIMAVCPPGNRPIYEPSKRRLTWPNGAIATCFAAEAPELLRGPQHEAAWADEFAKWQNLRKKDKEGGTAWDNLLMGLRVGDTTPQACVTTTPRNIAELRALLKRPSTVVTNGNSYENRGNLSPQWFADTVLAYEGTRLGRQEIYAELLDDAEGALWTRMMFDQARRSVDRDFLVRVVVSIDPATTKKQRSDETGIVAAGLGRDGHGYVLEDVGDKLSPDQWVRRALSLYDKYAADRIVAETNNGGDLVEYALRTARRSVSYKGLTASRGAMVRAEPVAALYEQGRVHHGANLGRLEDSCCQWEPGSGEHCPDNVSALVWGLTELMLERTQTVATISADTSWQREHWRR